jgi:hypothetical protein
VYTPSTNSWSLAGSLPASLIGLTMTVLPNGQVLEAGGSSQAAGTSADRRAALFTPSAKPSAPGAVSATATNRSAIVTFSPPVSDGGLPVQHYTVRASSGQAVNTPDARTVATVPALANGKPVTFTVTATNSLGTGPASVASAAVIPGPPSLELTGLKTKLKLKRFLKGISFSVTPNKPASLQLSLLGTIKRATISSAFNLTLASKSLALSAMSRKIRLVPSKKLIGHPHRGAKVELLIVATDSAGNRSTTIRKITLTG